MNLHQQKFAPLGEVVATAFDQAECYSTNPAEVARLASLAVMRLWLRSTQALTAWPSPVVGEQELQ
jgi:hypothetical protein